MHLFYVIFCINLSLNGDLNVSECLIADLKKNKRALCPGKGGAGEGSEKATLYLLHSPVCSAGKLIRSVKNQRQSGT